MGINRRLSEEKINDKFKPKMSGSSASINWRVRDGPKEIIKEIVISEDRQSFTYPRPGNYSMSLAYPLQMNRFKSTIKYLGEFSYNKKSKMSFLNPEYFPVRSDDVMKVKINLKEGKSKKEVFDPLTEVKYGLENWIIDNDHIYGKFLGATEDKTLKHGLVSRPGDKFVMVGKTIDLMLSLPYVYALEINFLAMRVDGIIYLKHGDLFNVAEKLEHRREEIETVLKNEQDGKGPNWEMSLNQIFLKTVTMDNSKERDDQLSFNKTGVFQAELGKHSILYATTLGHAIPDLFNGDIEESLSAFVKVYYKIDPISIKQKQCTKRYKMLRWYLHCFLTNGNKVLVGYRDEEGIVNRIHRYGDQDLLHYGKGLWEPAICFSFVSRLLSFISEHVGEEPGSSCLFTKNERSYNINCRKLDDSDPLVVEWPLIEYFSMKRLLKTCNDEGKLCETP